jgi:lysyl-tRNA synthetase class II
LEYSRSAQRAKTWADKTKKGDVPDQIKQLYVEKKVLNESYPEAFNHLTNLVDIGDIVGARGSVKRTDKGELSIKVSSFEMLTKAILPLPDKFHGLQDVEKRYRQRCVSLFFWCLFESQAWALTRGGGSSWECVGVSVACGRCF